MTPAHIARKQHYVTIFDILKTVTTTVVSWEEEHEELDQTLMLEHPDFMREHPFTELDEDGVAPSPSISHRLSSSNKKLKSNEDDNYYSSDVTEQKIAALMKKKLSMLRINESSLTETEQKKPSLGEVQLYSGHEKDDASHTEVSLTLSEEARKALIGLESHESGIIRASFKTTKKGITMNII
ncbi:unnamed protein product [Schistosoma mattheei]|uniref:Uncharacterized protein n=1 Tax=Schistosoma mattheei TaxID=31246 RepID=A0A3P8BWG7_9TREM|nr:unnamed protein product [Schistosoma mattheei]